MTTLGRGIRWLVVAAGVAGALVWLRSIEPAPPPPSDAGAQASEPIELWPSARRLAGEPDAPPDPGRARAVLRNNEAARLLEEGELARAVELFRACHRAFPTEGVFARNLAEALARLARQHWRERRLEPAVAGLEEALLLAPEREDAALLRETLERWRREAALAGGETTDSSPYFELSYDASREDVLRRAPAVLASLEGSYGFLRDWFGIDPVIEGGRDPIRVVLYAPRAFEEVVGLGDWAAGAFDGVVRVSVTDLEEERERWPRVARHELAHAFVREAGGGEAPGWLNEGLAQWLEDGGDRARREARVRRARELLAGAQGLFPIERLEGSLAAWSDRDAIARAYAQSLVLVDHVAAHYGEGVLREMVLGLAAGTPPAATFERSIGVPFSFVLTDLQNYLR